MQTADIKMSLNIKANSINRWDLCADSQMCLITVVWRKAAGLGRLRLCNQGKDVRRKTVTLANNYGCSGQFPDALRNSGANLFCTTVGRFYNAD